MRALSPLGKKKKGLSNVVAYVLLIAITISLSALIYTWLKNYVSYSGAAECPEGVSLIVSSYSCSAGGSLDITLKNRGRFVVDGYYLRVHDSPDAGFGLYLIDSDGLSFDMGEENTASYPLPRVVDGHTLNEVRYIEIQPFINDGGRVLCDNYDSRSIPCP